MAVKLSDNEIKERLQRLRNLEALYPKARKRIVFLEKENRAMKTQIKALNVLVRTQAEVIEKLKLRIEELEQMVFGRKKRNNQSNDDLLSNNQSNPLPKKPRDPQSYRRPLPKDEDITETKDYPIDLCPDCQTPLINYKTVIQYKEDIKLLNNALKQIEKQRVQTGWCPYCKKRKAPLPIQPQAVYLGENIKQFVSWANVVLRLSFEQIKSLLKATAQIEVSDGEISRILDNQAKQLIPQYNNLKADIRGQPGINFDETTYPLQKTSQGGYCWTITGTENQNSVFLLGQTRGKGNAQNLKGHFNQVGISDDYGAYRNLFKYHQLCWAHPLRKLKDLSLSEALTDEKKGLCLKTCQGLRALHDKLKISISQPFNLPQRQKTKSLLLDKFQRIAQVNQADPDKLKRIKSSLLKNKDKYFTCLDFENIPTTNNKAERALRHLVLKRHNSRGCKTDKGAFALSVLSSVLLSLWWSQPTNFFQEYSKMLTEANSQ